MAQITCPTCNPTGVLSPTGGMIAGPGVTRKFAGQAILCPKCQGTGYVDSGTQNPIPGLPIQGEADTPDGGSPNSLGDAVPMLNGP